MGKYSHLKSSLTSLTAEPEYQDKVNAEKERIGRLLVEQGKSGSIKDFALVLLEARIEKARLEALEKIQNLTIEATTQVLVELLEDQTLTSLKLENGVSMSIKDDVYCKIENRHEFYGWIKNSGLEDLLTVNYQTMSSLVKKRLTGEMTVPENEESTPPGVGVYFKQGIMIRGAKNLATEE
jgi:hypothetical protein